MSERENIPLSELQTNANPHLFPTGRISLREKLKAINLAKREATTDPLPQVLQPEIVFDSDDQIEEIEPVERVSDRSYDSRNQIKNPFPRIQETLMKGRDLLHQEAEQADGLTEDEKELAIALALWIENPGYLDALAEMKGTSSKEYAFRVLECLTNPRLKELGNLLYDRVLKSKKPSQALDVVDDIVESETFLGTVLNTHEKRVIFELKQKGKSSEEIAEILGKTVDQVRKTAEVIRGLSEKLFEAYGIFRIGSLIDGEPKTRGTKNWGGTQAAQRGTLHARKFMGLYYSNQRSISKWEIHRRYVNPALLDEGYVLLFLHTTEAQRHALRKAKKYAPYLKRDHGLTYIRPDDLTYCLSLLEPNTAPDLPPSRDHFPLRDFVQEGVTMNMLQKAIKNGELTASLTKNGYVITQDAFNKYIEENKVQDPNFQPLKKKGIPEAMYMQIKWRIKNGKIRSEKRKSRYWIHREDLERELPEVAVIFHANE